MKSSIVVATVASLALAAQAATFPIWAADAVIPADAAAECNGITFAKQENAFAVLSGDATQASTCSTKLTTVPQSGVAPLPALETTSKAYLCADFTADAALGTVPPKVKLGLNDVCPQKAQGACSTTLNTCVAGYTCTNDKCTLAPSTGKTFIAEIKGDKVLTLTNVVTTVATAITGITECKTGTLAVGSWIKNKNLKEAKMIWGVSDACLAKSADAETAIKNAIKDTKDPKLTLSSWNAATDLSTFDDCRVEGTPNTYPCPGSASALADCKSIKCNVGASCTENQTCGTNVCKGDTGKKVCSGSAVASTVFAVVGAAAVGLGLFF